MQLVQEVRGILGGMRDARAGCPSQNDDADEQRDASVDSKYSGHDCHRVYHTYQDDWSDFENEIRFRSGPLNTAASIAVILRPIARQ
jgi:hypothetical protein